MFRLQGRIPVERPPADVSAFLSNVANEKSWQGDIVHVELLEGEPGTSGAKWERVQVVSGRNIKTTTQLVDVTPGKHVAYQAKGKAIEYRVDYMLKPETRGTEVEMRFEGEMLGFAAMFESMAAEALEKSLPESLTRLKRALESG